MKTRWFASIVLLIIAFAVIRSAIATRLDGFTIDEPYHINAGVTYLRTGDYRLNPEQPPLVKLWVGAFMPRSFKLTPLRAIDSKIDERDFHETTVFARNDADVLQRRARIAMFAFHALALLAFAFAARRVFGPLIALGALAFLAIDPTVAAHMPVVMTDLPVALWSTIAVLCAATAFRTWRPLDLTLAAIALGLALGTKHNGVIAAAIVAGVAIVALIRQPSRAKHALLITTVLAGAFVILWAQYGFRYYETSPAVETFNSPLADKISDLHTPLFRSGLRLAIRTHLLPRAYLWGFADILRAGVEGRAYPFTFFGTTFIGATPWYYFPGMLAVKLPLGLLALAIAGIAIARRKLAIAFAIVAAFLLALMVSNSGYAGIRHALPIVPPLAIAAGAAIAWAIESRSRMRIAFAAAALLIAIVSAVPVLRPWEYFNAIAGGTENAYLHFSGEGTDLGQRTGELAEFYRTHIAPSRLAAYDQYGVLARDRERRHLSIIGLEDAVIDGNQLTGWFFISGPDLSSDIPWANFTPFRRVKPFARYGNLFIFRGSFDLPWIRSMHNFMSGIMLIHRPEPDLRASEKLIAEAASLTPRAYPIYITLGNTRARLGDRAGAIRAFIDARRYFPPNDALVPQIETQILRLRREDPRSLPQLKNPWAE